MYVFLRIKGTKLFYSLGRSNFIYRIRKWRVSGRGQRLYCWRLVESGDRDIATGTEQKWPRPTLPVVRLSFSRHQSRIFCIDTRATPIFTHAILQFLFESRFRASVRLFRIARVRQIERHNLSPDNRPPGVARVCATPRRQWQWTRISISPSSAGCARWRATTSCRYSTRRASNGSCRSRYAPAFPPWYVESEISAI